MEGLLKISLAEIFEEIKIKMSMEICFEGVSEKIRPEVFERIDEGFFLEKFPVKSM